MVQTVFFCLTQKKPYSADWNPLLNSLLRGAAMMLALERWCAVCPQIGATEQNVQG